jgi:hypothetical protein
VEKGTDVGVVFILGLGCVTNADRVPAHQMSAEFALQTPRTLPVLRVARVSPISLLPCRHVRSFSWELRSGAAPKPRALARSGSFRDT